ncbi:MAG: rod shape-determining protein RodA [Alphaproteobacteria bacterium]|nr:rod shape-determining protein RodA [Alphaproteobacteria bacterium]
MIRRESILGKLGGMHWFLLLTIVAIAVFGTAVLFSSASSAHDMQTGMAVLDARYAVEHAARFGVMMLVAVTIALAPLRLWAGLAFPAYFVGVAMLFGVEFAGVVVNGAERWLQLGPVQLQPSEFMKLAVPLALARYYHQMFQGQNNARYWVHLPALAIVLIPVALVLRQPDLGTALMIMGTGLAVIFFAGISLRIVAGVLVLVAIAAPLAFYFALHDYQRQRVLTLFNPEADLLGAGYQLNQAQIAVGSGGLAGKGFMEGAQKELDYIPEQHTDFIFTIIAEEFGFAGSVAVLIAWGVALYQGMTIASKSGSAFGGLAAAGFVSTLALYVFINIGMVIGLLPVVGIPLPLISYGGTVMLTVMVGFGLLMSVHLNRDNNIALRGII